MTTMMKMKTELLTTLLFNGTSCGGKAGVWTAGFFEAPWDNDLDLLNGYNDRSLISFIEKEKLSEKFSCFCITI